MISYNKLFEILCQRDVPKYLIRFLQNWYIFQLLYVKWGNTLSEAFGMQNGIRQGSCASPKLFSVYVDKLNLMLKNSRVGCHIADTCVNHFSYADDMVIVTPDAKSMNHLLNICNSFASEHFITYSITKTEAMVIKPRNLSDFSPPMLYLGGQSINYVEKFKYLGHIITIDDLDIEKEVKNLYIRGNTIVRKFGFLSNEVKLMLFKSYCYCIYGSSLWSKYRATTMNKLRVAYNNIFRKLIGEPPWGRARQNFVNLEVRSFYETTRHTSLSLMRRVLECRNSIVHAVRHSDALVHQPDAKSS